MTYITFVLVILSSVLLASSQSVTVKAGDDWSMPAWAKGSAYGGFFGDSIVAQKNINVGPFDVSWAQINPADGQYSWTTTGSSPPNEGSFAFKSFADQNKTTSPFWMRIWASASSSVPKWVVTDCQISALETDGDKHLPLWNQCMWGHLMTLYRKLFIEMNFRADPRLKMIYVPGAFEWCEFDFDEMIKGESKGLTWTIFNTWYQQAMADLVSIFNGDNTDPSDDYSYKLVYTGEDFPFGPEDWPADMYYTARDAVWKGTGIRTGITEQFNLHLSVLPAYGITVDSNGYMVANKSWPIRNNLNRIMATENECYTTCGYNAGSDVYYAVVMSNLKALQMGINWMYVVPIDSYMDAFADHWNWVLLGLGQTAQTSADAWAYLRDAQDGYWNEDVAQKAGVTQWKGFPYVKNFERFLVQRDISPDGVSVRGSYVKSNIPSPDNGIAYEGRKTNKAGGSNYLYFDVDEDYIQGSVGSGIQIKVSYLDAGSISWRIEYMTSSNGATQMNGTSYVQNTNSNTNKTATFSVDPSAVFSNSLTGNMDFRIFNGGSGDIQVYFVRIIKTSATSSSSATGTTATATGTTATATGTTANPVTATVTASVTAGSTIGTTTSLSTTGRHRPSHDDSQNLPSSGLSVKNISVQKICLLIFVVIVSCML